jgi:hypothetical protein
MNRSKVSSTRSIRILGAFIGARNIVAPAGPNASLSFFAMMIASAAPTASAGFNQAADHLELREQSRGAVPLVQLFDLTAKSYSAVLANG